MKFTLLKEIRHDRLMRPLLGGILIFIILFLISDMLQIKHHFGLHVKAVSDTLYGNEEAFIDPMSSEALFEIMHGMLFFTMMTLLSLSAIFGRLAPPCRWVPYAMHLLHLGAAGSIVLIIAAYYTFEGMVGIWLACLYSWHAIAFGMALFSLYRLYR